MHVQVLTMPTVPLNPTKDCWLAPSNESQLLLEIKDQGWWVLDMRRLIGRLRLGLIINWARCVFVICQ
jgi:hypothetical protein